MIYLIGVYHNIQHDGNGCADLSVRNKFQVFLMGKVKKYDIVLLAEEFSEEALQEHNATAGTLKYGADRLNIKHLFCDPNKEERKIIGILCREKIKSALNIRGGVHADSAEENRIKEKQKEYHPVREMFWFEKISNYLDRNIIFVCGADHVRSFETLLTSKEHKPVVLVENWAG